MDGQKIFVDHDNEEDFSEDIDLKQIYTLSKIFEKKTTLIFLNVNPQYFYILQISLIPLFLDILFYFSCCKHCSSKYIHVFIINVQLFHCLM